MTSDDDDERTYTPPERIRRGHRSLDESSEYEDPTNASTFGDDDDDDDDDDDNDDDDDVEVRRRPDSREGDDEDDDLEEEEEDGAGDTVVGSPGGDDGSPSKMESSVSTVKAMPTLRAVTDLAHKFREIGHEAAWSLSTAKPGNGVEQLRDNSADTYWQSDGTQPHLINVQFPRRASVALVALHLDYNLDESYTPKRISIRAGMTFHDLEQIRIVELHEPSGWVSLFLTLQSDDPLDEVHDDQDDDPEQDDNEDDHDDDDRTDEYDSDPEDDTRRGRRRRRRHKPPRAPIRTHFVQICVQAMHQNGRDTHIRQVKIFGPRHDGELVAGRGGGPSHPIPTTCHHNNHKQNRQTDDGAWVCHVPKFQTVRMSQFSTIR